MRFAFAALVGRLKPHELSRPPHSSGVAEFRGITFTLACALEWWFEPGAEGTIWASRPPPPSRFSGGPSLSDSDGQPPLGRSRKIVLCSSYAHILFKKRSTIIF